MASQVHGCGAWHVDHLLFVGYCFLTADVLLNPFPVQGLYFSTSPSGWEPISLSAPCLPLLPPTPDSSTDWPPWQTPACPMQLCLCYCQDWKEAGTLLKFASSPFGQQSCFLGLAEIFITTSLCEVSTPLTLREV